MAREDQPRSRLQISSPPPDVIQPVVAAAARAMEAESGLRLSAPPADVVQPVQPAPRTAQATRAAALAGEGNGGGLRLSAPPADIVQPVEPVAPATAQAAAADETQLPLSLKEADYSDTLGEEECPARELAAQAAVALDNREIYRIIREVALADSGDDLYQAISADREYDTAGQPAHQSRHFGLAFGLVLFTQESGRLGSVLQLMYQRDPDTFNAIFGEQAAALLATANASTAQARLAAVGGEPLSSASWVERFRRAGAVTAFQAAQNEEAIEGQFRPMLKVAFGLGLTTDRALAMVYDRVVTRGLGGGLRWVVEAACPLQTAAQRAQALGALGFKSVAQFQASVSLVQNGRFDPRTLAELTDALRRAGSIPLPAASELTGRLVAAATGPARQRLARLRDSAGFKDVSYNLAAVTGD